MAHVPAVAPRDTLLAYLARRSGRSVVLGRRTVLIAASAVVLGSFTATLTTAHAVQGRRVASAPPVVEVLTGTTRCTGVAVSPDLVVTAEHCVPTADQLDVRILAGGRLVAPQRILANPSLDIAAVVMPAPLTSGGWPPGLLNPSKSAVLYGRGSDLQQAPFGTLRAADLPSRPDMAPDGSIWWRERANAAGCPGDSGGPIVQDKRVVAIATNADCTGEGHIVGIPTPAILAWLAQQPDVTLPGSATSGPPVHAAPAAE